MISAQQIWPDEFFQINSDIDFICGVDDLVRDTASSAKRTQPLYYYQFSYDGALGFFKKKLNIDRAGDKNAPISHIGALHSQQ